MPIAHYLVRLKVVEPDFQKMSVFTKLDKLRVKLHEEVVKPTASPNILTLNCSEKWSSEKRPFVVTE